MDYDDKKKLDLARLRARAAEKPRTKVGQVRQAWPEIQALFQAGHSLKDIWAWLNEIGIEIGYARLSHYIGQLRRRDQAAGVRDAVRSTLETSQPENHAPPDLSDPVAQEIRPEPKRTPVEGDPLANILEREGQRPGFRYNSEPDSKKLI